MKNLINVVLLLLVTQQLVAQTELWQDPSVANQNAEQARSVIRNYNGTNEALVAANQSLYVQALEDWQSEKLDDGIIRYKTSFKVPFAWVDRSAFLHLDAVDGAFNVYVNEDFVGYSHGGETAVEFDLAGFAKEGRNEVCVEVSTKSISASLENFKKGNLGALGQDNYIISQPKVRLRDIIYKADVQNGEGFFSLGVIMKSHLLNTKELNVHYELLSPKGKVISSGRRDAKFNMQSEDTVRFLANIPNVRTWTQEQANLYRLVIKTQYEGRFIEYLSFEIGFRAKEYRDGDLYINNTKVDLRAIEYSPKSDSLSLDADLRRFKNGGVNLIKVKDKPADQLFYQLCDRMGFYVIDQVAINTSSGGDSRKVEGNLSNNPEWEQLFVDRSARSYFNTKNHSCIVGYSYATDSANGYNLYQSYLTLKQLDPDQSIFYFDSDKEWNSDKINILEILDSESLSSSRNEATQGYPISFAGDDIKSGVFKVNNSFVFKAMHDLVIDYKIKVAKITRESGSLELTVQPSNHTLITLPYPELKPGQKVSVELTAREVEAPTYYLFTPPVKQDESGSKLSQLISNIKEGLSEEKIPSKVVGEGIFDFEY